MQTLTEDYNRTKIRVPPKLLSGLDEKLRSVAGSFKGGHNIVMSMVQDAEDVDGRAPQWKDLPDNRIRGKLLEYKQAFRRQKKGFEEIIPDALAAIREAAFRRVGLRPYVVQIAGALALYGDYVVEMATGEGKTLTAAVAMIMRGWTGVPCHLITVNDYLAARDAKWMSPLYEFCGVTAGAVTGEMDPEERRAGHHCDVTYTTSKEIVADFLRDRLWLGSMQKANRRQVAWLLGKGAELLQGTVMRGIHSAIVDEADSILVDEAVTPLIISTASPNDTFIDACRLAHSIAASLQLGEDYEKNEKYKDIELRPKAKAKIAESVEGSEVGYRSVPGYLELVKQAVSAKEYFHRDHQYVVQDDTVVIVDEFTGRQMPQRSWRAGLHQFVEANENLPMTTPTETLARLSFQRFFRFFHHLSGMTGTAKESGQELWDIYGLPVLRIPENKPCIRAVYPTRAFPDLESKWRAIVGEIEQIHATGRPILVGTRSVRASEELALRLDAAGLSYQLLNAVRHSEEAVIVAMGGEVGQITIATNMAGRGTDIKLGKGVAESGGLHVIASECHESRRIDRQLFGRCARQGDPGSARLFVCMEDELIRRHVPEPLRRIVWLQQKGRIPGGRAAATTVVGWAQTVAQRIAYRQRRSVLRTDTWLEDSLSFAQRDVM